MLLETPEATVRRIHECNPETAAKIISNLSPGEADQVLLVYRDRYERPDGDRNFRLLERRLFERK